MEIVDRAKDIIKSGGEWISSVMLENAALAHPQVRQAAVVGAPHPKWNERPVLFVVAADPASLSIEAVLAHVAAKVPRWWRPERIEVLPALPLGATGKIEEEAPRHGGAPLSRGCSRRRVRLNAYRRSAGAQARMTRGASREVADRG